MDASVSRRRFLAQGAGGLSSVWVSAHWPALLAAATHARHAAQSAVAAKFEFFGAEEAKEVDAVTSRIIPSDETPGAHEAGVVYFIDRALTTFGIDDQKTYREGFLIDPDYGGNRDGAGWKVIGRAREYMFQPPFGYYDKGYPGWEVAAKEEMKEAEKK